jgi:hypothetical protein
LDLEQRGIPLLEHEAALTEETRGDMRLSTIRVSRSGKEQSLSFESSAEGRDLAYAEFPDEKGQRRAVAVLTNSVLDDLRRAADELSHRSPFNALRLTSLGVEPACLWLLLTGKALPLIPVGVTREVPGSVDSVTIHALTRVASPKSVAKAYALMQRRTLGRRKGRQYEPRNLALVLFVEKRAGDLVHKMAPAFAKQVWLEWNQKHPGRRKGGFSDWRDLSRAYGRAKAAFFDDPNIHPYVVLAMVEAAIARRRGEEPPSVRDILLPHLLGPNPVSDSES